jgi:hypothetical protein
LPPTTIRIIDFLDMRERTRIEGNGISPQRHRDHRETSVISVSLW